MAAITIVTPSPGSLYVGGLYETVAIVNQTAASTTVRKAIAVPKSARYCTVLVDVTALGGTSPSFDFDLHGYNGAANSFGAPDDGFLYPLRDGFNYTAKTAPSQSAIYIGPDLTEELTGSATADDSYSLAVPLPSWLIYSYTTVDSADDADYDATISAFFRK